MCLWSLWLRARPPTRLWGMCYLRAPSLPTEQLRARLGVLARYSELLFGSHTSSCAPRPRSTGPPLLRAPGRAQNCQKFPRGSAPRPRPPRARSARTPAKGRNLERKKRERGTEGRGKNHSTRDSHVVPHHGTNRAVLRLTAQIGRDAVLSESYGRGYLPCCRGLKYPLPRPNASL